jgi:hypothetical protein
MNGSYQAEIILLPLRLIQEQPRQTSPFFGIDPTMPHQHGTPESYGETPYSFVRAIVGKFEIESCTAGPATPTIQ